MEFSVLGPLEVYRDRGEIALSPKLRDLLAVLLCRPNATVTGERLILALWTSSSPPRSAVKTLQAYVHYLRRALGAERLESRSAGYALLVRPDEVDAVRFTTLVGQGRAAIAAGRREEGAGVLRAAVALWRGTAFDGQDYLPPVRGEAVRLTELQLAATEERIEIELALGRHADLVWELRGMVAEHPFREGPRAQLMLALYRTGRATEALEVCREGKRLLAEEFGLDPGPMLRDMEQAVLNHSVDGPCRGRLVANGKGPGHPPPGPVR